MAKIKNLTNQLEVVGSKGEFNDNVSFYNKRNASDIVRLGVSVDGNELIISTASDTGELLTELERFEYSKITLPESENITDLVEQVNVFIQSEPDAPLTPVAVSENVIPIGNAAGDGIEDSNMIIEDFGGSDVYLSHIDDAGGTGNYIIYKAGGGGENTWINSSSGSALNLSINDGVKVAIKDGLGSGVSMVANVVNDILAIGLGTQDSGAGARQHTRGLGITNATNALTVSNRDDELDYSFQVRDDRSVFLHSGTGVNEITIGGDYSSATDDQLPTRLDVKTYVEGLVTPQIIGGLVVTSTSTTNVSSGSYNILEDTTALTSVSSGIAQDSDWTLEITEAGITNQKGRVSAVIKCEKTGGAGRQYDFAIFKNGSILSDSEMSDLTLENNDTWGNIKCTAPIEMSTGDLFSLRVSGNGTGDDIECTNGTIYID